MSEMGEKKQLVVNMAASLVTFAVQVGINFILTPYITTKLGAEAYGFVNLSNTMVNYITILTVAITSMASRFISIALFRDDKGGGAGILLVHPRDARGLRRGRGRPCPRLHLRHRQAA